MRERGAAVVLLSGGIDSTTCLAHAVSEGFLPFPLTFIYGQRHTVEVERARQIRDHFGIEPEHHRIVDLGPALGGSALTGNGEIPVGRSPERMAAEIPSTYVPARNIVFLALAAAYAEVIGARDIFIGVNAIDYSGYPDCRPGFITAFQGALSLGTRCGVEGSPLRLRTPLARLAKSDIIRLGHALGTPYHLTYSCYQGTVPACGRCDSCLLRLKGFREAGLADPAPYASKPNSPPR